jgi:hypothetical protein
VARNWRAAPGCQRATLPSRAREGGDCRGEDALHQASWHAERLIVQGVGVCRLGKYVVISKGGHDDSCGEYAAFKVTG